MGGVVGQIAGAVVSNAFADDGSAAVGAQVDAANEARQISEKALREAIAKLDAAKAEGRQDLQTNFNFGYNQTAPYVLGGANAYDDLLDQLGVARPKNVSSFQLNQALNLDQQNKLAKEKFDKGDSRLMEIANLVNSAFPYWEGAGQAASIAAPGSDYELQLLKDFAAQGPGISSSGIDLMGDNLSSAQKASLASLLPQVQDFLKDYDPNKEFTPLLTAEQQALADSYNKGTIETQRANPTDALGKFLNSTEYRLLFGNGDKTIDPNATAIERFQAGPGYQFAMDQGVKARDASAAARGMLLSGNQLAELTQFGQGLANQEFNNYQAKLSDTYNNYITRLGGVSGIGANLASSGRAIAQDQGNSLANLSMNYGNNVANLITNQGDNAANAALAAGNARASGYMNQANQNNSLWGSIGNAVTTGFDDYFKNNRISSYF